MNKQVILESMEIFDVFIWHSSSCVILIEY
jgi:hypothetical protein